MSSRSTSTPIVVQGIVVDDTSGDAALAARLQQEESNRARAGAGTATAQPVVMGQTYYQRHEYADYDEERPVLRSSDPLTDRELEVLEVWSLGRGIVCLAILDIFLLLFLSILDIYYLLLFWGPLCGVIGSTTFEACYIYFYIIYYILRIAGDTTMLFGGNLWSILSLFCDVIIITYVIIFVTYISNLTKAEKELLKDPYPLLRRNRNSYYYFY